MLRWFRAGMAAALLSLASTSLHGADAKDGLEAEGQYFRDRNGVWVQAPAGEIQVGELVQVRPGDLVPLDGEVVAGASKVDQASLTGESVPIPKKPGDTVFGGTLNENGSLEIRVTRRAAESTIAKLIQLVEVAQGEKAQTQRFIDTAEQYYAMAVIVFTGLAIAFPLLVLGEAFDPAFYRAMTLMVAASPCALVISTPATILSAIGNAARRGILFKGGVYVERGADIRAIAFDKTGTLTIGRRTVTDIVLLPTANGSWAGDENALLALAASLQSGSEHSLAQATVGAANDREIPIAKSLVDYIFRWLAIKFLPQEHEGHDEDGTGDGVSSGAPAAATSAASTSKKTASSGRTQPGRPSRAPAGDAHKGLTNGHGPSPLEVKEKRIFLLQADAPPCTDCGSIMVRNGACYKCLNCGTTSGCS